MQDQTAKKAEEKSQFKLDDAAKKTAIEHLPTVMDLTRWLNGALSEALKENKEFTEESSQAFIEKLKVESLWDAVAMFVFQTLHLPIDKASLVMYSNLSPAEKEAVIEKLEQAISQIIAPAEKPPAEDAA